MCKLLDNDLQSMTEGHGNVAIQREYKPRIYMTDLEYDECCLRDVIVLDLVGDCMLCIRVSDSWNALDRNEIDTADRW